MIDLNKTIEMLESGFGFDRANENIYNVTKQCVAYKKLNPKLRIKITVIITNYCNLQISGEILGFENDENNKIKITYEQPCDLNDKNFNIEYINKLVKATIALTLNKFEESLLNPLIDNVKDLKFKIEKHE